MRIDCAEWRHLVELHREVQVELSRRLAELSSAACAQQKDTFERAWAACEEQRRLCSQTGEQINDHLRQHLDATPRLKSS